MLANFEYYKIFYMIASCKSISAAARKLDLTQPTVSHALQNLEEQLGCLLFTRGKKGVRLTAEGERIFHYVENAYKNLSRAEQELRLLQENKIGELIVGANETTLHHFLLPHLKEYRKQYEGIFLKIHNNVTPKILEQIQNDVIDCGIILCYSQFEKQNTIKDLYIQPLEKKMYCMIAGNQYKELKGKKLHLKDLEEFPYIALAAETTVGTEVSSYFQKQNLNLVPSIVLQTADLMVPTVANDLGIGFVPEDFAKEGIKRGDIFKIDLIEELPFSYVSFVCMKKRLLKPSVKMFQKMIGRNPLPVVKG